MGSFVIYNIYVNIYKMYFETFFWEVSIGHTVDTIGVHGTKKTKNPRIRLSELLKIISRPNPNHRPPLGTPDWKVMSLAIK